MVKMPQLVRLTANEMFLSIPRRRLAIAGLAVAAALALRFSGLFTADVNPAVGFCCPSNRQGMVCMQADRMTCLRMGDRNGNTYVSAAIRDAKNKCDDICDAPVICCVPADPDTGDAAYCESYSIEDCKGDLLGGTPMRGQTMDQCNARAALNCAPVAAQGAGVGVGGAGGGVLPGGAGGAGNRPGGWFSGFRPGGAGNRPGWGTHGWRPTWWPWGGGNRPGGGGGGRRQWKCGWQQARWRHD
ncbi:hypothetical protein HYW84_04140 [Candidatus Peregrinibacteria bacterium]|nr:hypothetical protein [Candidatus Peregrinibacteria bacterium]